MFWAKQAKRGKEPASVVKMALGCLMLGVSFLVLMLATRGIGETQRITFLWLVLCTFIYTLGELYLSPIGLSLVTKIAPARLVSMLMGMWFLSSFFGNYLSGYLGTYYEKMPKDSFFMMLTLLGVIAGAAMFALKKPLKKAIGEDI
jgi:POT family proton-dependent oligopeptide transporter